MPTATEYAADLVASVRDDPAGRAASMRSLYEAEPGRPEPHLPYRRAALAFMGWQLRRGLLNAVGGEVPGSPWWRAVNERLLRDTAEARAHLLGLSGPTSSWSATRSRGIRPAAVGQDWYRAHNASIVSAYLDHRELAESETHPERFFLNLILVRVLFAHALVAAPRPALSWLSPVGPVLGDPRLHGHRNLRLALAGDAGPVPVDQRPPVVHRQRARVRADPRPGHDPATARGALLVVRSRAVDSRALHPGPRRRARLLVGRHRCGPWDPATGRLARAARSGAPRTRTSTSWRSLVTGGRTARSSWHGPCACSVRLSELPRRSESTRLDVEGRVPGSEPCRKTRRESWRMRR